LNKFMEIKNSQSCGSMYCSYGYSIYLGNLARVKLHSHHMTEIIIGNKKRVNLITENDIYKDYIILVGPDVLHSAKDIEKDIIIILLDPESEISLKITSKYLSNKEVAPIPVKRDIKAINRYFKEPTIENAIKIYRSIISSLELTDNINNQKDPRIIEAVNYIRNLEVKKASTKEIAEHVGLSEGRLTHLFKKQIGIPIRKYLVWYRINHAIFTLLNGKSLTYAAHEAEFADYAHLSRNFTAMFGYPISEFVKNIRFFTIDTPQ
jgi:AraC-like DNA-binding protein